MLTILPLHDSEKQVANLIHVCSLFKNTESATMYGSYVFTLMK